MSVFTVYYRAYSRIAGAAAALPLAGSARKQLLPSGRLLIRGNLDTKGQIISKGLFGVLEVSQKTNERIHHSSKNEFIRSFFWENSRIPKVLLKLSDL